MAVGYTGEGKMKYKSLVLGMVSAIMIPFAYASSNIAVVDIKLIAENSAEMKSLSKNLEQKFKPRQEALMKRDKDFRAKAEKYKTDAVTMAKAEKAKMETELDKEQTQLRDEQNKFQQEFFAEQNAGYKLYIDKLKQNVANVAKEKGYALVLQKNDAIALYSDKSVDITKDVQAKFIQ